MCPAAVQGSVAHGASLSVAGGIPDTETAPGRLDLDSGSSRSSWSSTVASEARATTFLSPLIHPLLCDRIANAPFSPAASSLRPQSQAGSCQCSQRFLLWFLWLLWRNLRLQRIPDCAATSLRPSHCNRDYPVQERLGAPSAASRGLRNDRQDGPRPPSTRSQASLQQRAAGARRPSGAPVPDRSPSSSASQMEPRSSGPQVKATRPSSSSATSTDA